MERCRRQGQQRFGSRSTGIGHGPIISTRNIVDTDTFTLHMSIRPAEASSLSRRSATASARSLSAMASTNTFSPKQARGKRLQIRSAQSDHNGRELRRRNGRWRPAVLGNNFTSLCSRLCFPVPFAQTLGRQKELGRVAAIRDTSEVLEIAASPCACAFSKTCSGRSNS